MSNILLKRSAVPDKIPSVEQLDLGELAINTYDGKIFIKKYQEYFDEALQETVTVEDVVEFTSHISVENTLYVQKSGNDKNDGTSWSSAFETIEAAVAAAAVRDTLTLIDVGPGTYLSKGHIDVSDNTVIKAVYRSVFIRPEPGYEERNVFRLGSGCFIEGFVFEGWRLDDLENPTEGFAACFRPGAFITRVPYVHKVAIRTVPYWTTVAPPLDRENANPLVGRGAGVVLADAAVISPDSVFPNIMTWGATPVSHNGIGYCAKNGALINAVNAISIWAHIHFYAIDGGQIVLSSCSTQFGDYTLVSKGTKKIINPSEVDIALTPNQLASDAITASSSTIISSLINELETQGFTDNWPESYTTLTERDAGLFLQSMSWVLASANEQPMLDFSKGLFDVKGNRAFTSIPYNYDKCYRDTGLITEAIAYDLAYGSNYRSINAALSYYRASANNVLTTQLSSTILALEKQKTLVLEYLSGTSLSRANALFNEIIDIITNGNESANDYIYPDPTGYDSGYFEARRLLVSNKIFIQDEIDAWIAVQISGNISPFTTEFTYDEAACRRDVGLIVDALVYDITYGGNLETYNSAVAYFVGTTSQLGDGEKAATLAAYTRLKNILEDILQANAIIRSSGNTTVQDTSGTAGSLSASLFAQDRIQEIYNTIDLDGILPTKILPDMTWPDDEFTISFSLLNNNTTNISNDVMSYLSTIETSYDYDKSHRDALLINEAIAYDMLFNSNYRTINAGLAYYRASSNRVVTEFKAVTLEALGRQKITFGSYLTGASLIRANSLFDEVIDIITNGPSAADAYSLIDPTSYDSGYFEARRLLLANKTFIQDEIEAWIKYQISNTIVPFNETPFTYDDVVCRRDIGLIIDAIGYDIMFDSNARTLTAATSYYRNAAINVTTIQKEATVSAFEQLRTSLLGIVTGNIIAENKINDSIDIMVNALEDGLISLPDKVITDPTGGTNNSSDAGYLNARTLIELNREFIKLEIQGHIKYNNPSVFASYDEQACLRDVDYILNAIYYDMTYGGNLETIIASNSYYSGTTLQLGDGEFFATISAYEYLKTLLSDISTNTVILNPYQTYKTQKTNTEDGSAAAALAASDLVDTLISTISTGTPQSEVLPDTSWVNTTLVTAFNDLQSNKNSVQTTITDYIDSTYVYGFFDFVSCKRDVGFIIDAIVYDITYGGNLETYNAAISYFVDNASQLGPTEKTATLAAYARLRSVISDVLQTIVVSPVFTTTAQDTTGSPGSSNAITFALDRVTNITTTISTDGNAPVKILPNTSWPDVEFQTSFATINNNTILIANDALKYINVENKTLLGAFVYAWEYMRDQIKALPNLDPTADTIVDELVDALIRTVLSPSRVSLPSVITAIGHTWTGIMAGVALTKIPPAYNTTVIEESILELDSGTVIASGQDDQGSALFIGGMKIDADTGELSGPPFDTAVNRIATRAAIARSF